jgi:phosphoglycerate dehydrogenase-like enzyme
VQKPRVAIACSEQTWRYFSRDDALSQLETFAEWHFEPFDVPSGGDEPPKASPADEARFLAAAENATALVVSNGSPFISGELLDQLPSVHFVGDLGGDRFSALIDVESCWRRGIPVVDTNNSASLPVAEWALAFSLVGLRNYGSIFRRMVCAHELVPPGLPRDQLGYARGELTGRTVGLVGFGHIARHLVKLMAGFEVTVFAYDPYVPIELAGAYGVTLTSLDNVLRLGEVVCCLVPITPATERMLGQEQFALLQPGCVFVNVSRGKVVDHEALLARLRQGDIVACLDVFDPEPVPIDSPFLDLPNVLVSPHIGSGTSGSESRGIRLMVEELERYFAGHQTRFDLLPRTIENRRGLPPGTLSGR